MDTILIDLDGTLLPMDMPKFMEIYLGELGKKCAEHGCDAKASVKAVMQGAKAMLQNDGSLTNEQCFWREFEQAMGPHAKQLKPILEKFYECEFNKAQAATKENPSAAKLVRGLRKKGYTVVLATNPLFPVAAVRTRLSWIGLEPEDFSYITSYNNSHYCKPNPSYYTEILSAVGKEPQQCLMVGNDATEDGAAHKAGIQLFLVTDYLINAKNEDVSAFTSGDFEQCCAYIHERFCKADAL